MNQKYENMERGNDPTTIEIVKEKNSKYFLINDGKNKFLLGRDIKGNYYFDLQSDASFLVLPLHPFMYYVQERLTGYVFDFFKCCLGRSILDDAYSSMPSDFLEVNPNSGQTYLLLHSDTTSNDLMLSHHPDDFDHLYFIVTSRNKSLNEGNRIVLTREGPYRAFISSFDDLFDHFDYFIDPEVEIEQPLLDSHFKVTSTSNLKTFQKDDKKFSLYTDSQRDYYFVPDNTHPLFSIDLCKMESGTSERAVYDHFNTLMERIYGQVIMEGSFRARRYPDEFLIPHQKMILWKHDDGYNQALRLTHEKDVIHLSIGPYSLDKAPRTIDDVRICASGSAYRSQYLNFAQLFHEIDQTFPDTSKKTYTK